MPDPTFSAEDETAMIELGERFVPMLEDGIIVYLQGELGAGKTTLVRSMLKAAGVTGAIKSPTYTLIESYPLLDIQIHHADLYRLGDPEELEYIGIRDYLDGSTCLLVEWPDKGKGVLPECDVSIQISYADKGRNIALKAESSKGQIALEKLVNL